MEKYDKKSLSVNYDVKEIERQIIQIIKNKCIQVLQLISGQEVNTENMSDSEIQSLLHTKLDQLGLDVMETESLYKTFDKKFQTYQKVINYLFEFIQLI